MDITPVVADGLQLINGYGDGGFTITGERHEGSVLVLPEQTQPWPVADLSALTLDSLSPITSLQPVPSILLVGCGRGMQILPRDLRAALKAAGIAVESMDTGAACRTYNILLTEGRSVAAALIAI